MLRINGVVHHRIGSMLPSVGETPQFAQLYVYDTEHELQNRLNVFDATSEQGASPDPSIVDALIKMLDHCNPLVKKFRASRQRVFSSGENNISIRIIGSESTSGDQYIPPIAWEPAALIVRDLNTEAYRFDIVVHTLSGPSRQISPLHPALMSLEYPLLFPYGDKGFYVGLKLVEIEGQLPPARGNASMLEYYCYWCHYRKGQTNRYICCGHLSDQAIVNTYSCVECSRLAFIAEHQDQLRTETY